MIFSSVEFILFFLPAFFLVYGITPAKYKNSTLLLGSLIFYAMGDAKYLALLVVLVIVNYRIGLILGKRKRRGLFVMAVAGNLLVLVLCKITMGAEGIPLGISFYTFQMLSYLIDVYRREIKEENSFLRFATYVMMFPQLIMGPIVAYGEVGKELEKRKITAVHIQDGLKIFIIGLSFKVLLADRIGTLWHSVMVTGVESISTAMAWIGAIAYSMNLYFDFYGYSLMAIGLGRMLGFHLPRNFRSPYMARSVRDFYRRWHITLGRWFCKYVYIPLGGNRKGELRTITNLFVVWLLTSLWHGFSANFFIWGGILLCCIVLERCVERTGICANWKVLPHVYLWLVIPITWMCFAITDLSQLRVYLGRMFGVIPGVNVRSSDWLWALEDYWYLFLAAFVACTPITQKIYKRFRKNILFMLLLAGLLWVCVWRLTVEGNNPFMYFRF